MKVAIWILDYDSLTVGVNTHIQKSVLNKIMQIWIYFQAGVGGDGFANLLERSQTITSFDQHDRPWRLHRFVDNCPKFWAPTVDKNGCFRTGHPFNSKNNTLNQNYVDHVNQGTNIICTSHDTSLELLEMSDCADVFLKNQIKVVLQHQNPIDAYKQYAIKNLRNITADLSYAKLPKSIDFKKFDYVVSIEKIQTDWNYASKICNDLNIELDQAEYQDYRCILAGSTQFDQPGVERYQSHIENAQFHYRKTN